MINDVLGKKHLFFDGAMGTVLQNSGLELGELPENFNFTQPEVIEAIHLDYLKAGADFITTNTFGANRYKAQKSSYSVSQMIEQAVKLAQNARRTFPDAYIALDVGPSGKMLQPIGDVSFDEAYDVFKEQVTAGEKAGCDVILFETFTDLYELKAAVLAAKENTKLPVFCTMSFEENGRTFFGTSIAAMVLTLEGLGADAIGVNCSLGPKQLKPIVEELMKRSSVPVIVQPNAGLPVMNGSKAQYDVSADEFAKLTREFADLGVSLFGGCCGTSCEYIEKMKKAVSAASYKMPEKKQITGICSHAAAVYFDDIVIIGERLNPTGKKLLQAALRNHDMDYVLGEAIKQQEQGAHVLDVNMGLPDIDEAAMLKQAVIEVQGVVNLPLQIDSSNVSALEAATRVYNGKPIINSVNGKKESLASVLPIVKKYGACVLGLTLDEKGIPSTAEERLSIAEKIVNAATAIGIPKQDVLIDCLVVTASAQQELVQETLRAVRLVKEKLGVKTVLGVSNVSFGLPNRPLINKTMLAAALMQGLDAPIMNPGDTGMTDTINAFRVLLGKDKDSKDYTDQYAEQKAPGADTAAVQSADTNCDLKAAIISGLKEEAKAATLFCLKTMPALDIINEFIVPALDEVGKYYESQTIYLPQLIKSAEAAKKSFEELKNQLAAHPEEAPLAKTKVVLATVYGDIHDIGKNIVKVIMENYNFEILDLGKDVPTEQIIQAVKENNIKIVGLSALMTTTVNSMKETITKLKEECPDTKVIVGGAVLTKELSNYVGADYYAKDAMETVKIAQQL